VNPLFLSSYLVEIKDRFPPARALLVLDDKTLRRYVLSWSPMLVRVVKEWPDDDSLAAAWACVEVDTDALADLTGDSPPAMAAALRQLQRLEMVYPDGTIPAAVTKVLNKRFRIEAEE
jgi:hypothetical protein